MLQFINDFDMSAIKQMYFTSHPLTETIRAWQGHKIESRWFICVNGVFIINLVNVDDWENPSDTCEIYEFELTADNTQVLYTPSGYANDIRALEKLKTSYTIRL